MKTLSTKDLLLLRHMTLRKKTITLFLLLIAIPLSIQGIVTYYEFSKSVERRTAVYSSQIVEQINRNLDRDIMELQRLSLLPLYDQRVLSILKQNNQTVPGNYYPSYADLEKMTFFISGMTFNRPEVEGIHIIANNGYVFSNLDPTTVRFFIDVKKEDWYQRVLDGDGAVVLIPTHKPGYYFVNGRTGYFSLARLIREPNTNATLGIIKIDLRLDMIRQILTNTQFSEYGNLFIINGNNELFFENQSSNLMPRFSDMLKDTKLLSLNSEKQVDIQDKRFLLVNHQSNETGLKVISLIPIETLLTETKRLRNFTFIIAAVCLMAAGGLAVIFAYNLSAPLVRLKKKMLKVEQGNFSQRVPVESLDEIGQLSAGFNKMVEEINRLVKEVYVIGLREKESELAALQSQINPHFIYNTLESINMIAISNGNFDVSDMVSALGKLLRYTVDRPDRFVTLREELDSINFYMRIQQVRYGERLRVNFLVDENLYDLPVPKLLFQPLVENAIYHGIGDRENGGTIWIETFRSEDALILSVKDDGKGLTNEQITDLRNSLTFSEPFNPKGHGLALRNVHQRIVLLYGNEYGLYIDGNEGQGASFTLTLPISERRDQDVSSIGGRR